MDLLGNLTFKRLFTRTLPYFVTTLGIPSSQSCYLQDIPLKTFYSFQHQYKRVILVDLRYCGSEAHNTGRLLKMKEDRPINWFLNLTYKERLIALALLCLKTN